MFVFERALGFSVYVLQHHLPPREQSGAGQGHCSGGVWPNPQLMLTWFSFGPVVIAELLGFILVCLVVP